jgi:ubiquinone/menaquinone biosynthesis C-methylase UbiE
MAETAEQSYLPALRFKALTPLFDTFVSVALREGAFKQRLVEQASVPRGGSVLDLGAGTGTLAIRLKRRHAHARVTGLDADPGILAIARRKAEQAQTEIDFVEALSTDIPLPDASQDTVVSTLFFHHLDGATKRRTLAEINRVLKPGGELHVGDWGRPRDPLQAALVVPVRAFDGFGVTADNVAGRLPQLATEAGLADARVRDSLRTPLGTLELLSARKPA